MEVVEVVEAAEVNTTQTALDHGIRITPDSTIIRPDQMDPALQDTCIKLDPMAE